MYQAISVLFQKSKLLFKRFSKTFVKLCKQKTERVKTTYCLYIIINIIFFTSFRVRTVENISMLNN